MVEEAEVSDAPAAVDEMVEEAEVSDAPAAVDEMVEEADEVVDLVDEGALAQADGAAETADKA
jgi:soluble cytochrome b562